jgi:hypothetical protein
MPNRTPLLPDSSFPPVPCQHCGASALLVRLSPGSTPGSFVRRYECLDCKADFEISEPSDADIQALAERMAELPPEAAPRPSRQRR